MHVFVLDVATTVCPAFPILLQWHVEGSIFYLGMKVVIACAC
jgi:hypothetical protein